MFKTLLTLLTALVLLSSCDSTKYNVDYDKEFDFSKLKTYKFLPWSPQNSERINELDRDRLYDAIRGELAARNMSEVEDDPDAFVNLIILMQQKTGVTGYTDYYSPYGYGYGYGYGRSHTSYSQYSYTDGTMLVDVFDAREKRLVWQGSAAGEVKGNQKSYQKEADIRSLMSKVFSFYPIKKSNR